MAGCLHCKSRRRHLLRSRACSSISRRAPDGRLRRAASLTASTPLPTAARRSIPKNSRDLTIDCLDELHRQVHEAGLRIAAVAGSAFWHSFCGVDETASPRCPILHLLDTRSAVEIARVPNTHARTGCVRIPATGPRSCSGWSAIAPANFAPRIAGSQLSRISFRKALRRSPSLHLHGLRHRTVEPERQRLRRRDARRAAHPPRSTRRSGRHGSTASTICCREYRDLWPAFAEHARGFPRSATAPANHIGSGCVSAGSVLADGRHHRRHARWFPARPGMEFRRVCGAIGWIAIAFAHGRRAFKRRRRLRLAEAHSRPSQRRRGAPGSRRRPAATASPCCRFSRASARPTGAPICAAPSPACRSSTEPFDILHAALESISLRFREIYCAAGVALACLPEVIASGGALLHSPAWTQMMADALGRPRDALHRTGSFQPRRGSVGAGTARRDSDGLDACPASIGATFIAAPDIRIAYPDVCLARQHTLYEKLFAMTPDTRTRRAAFDCC